MLLCWGCGGRWERAWTLVCHKNEKWPAGVLRLRFVKTEQVQQNCRYDRRNVKGALSRLAQ